MALLSLKNLLIFAVVILLGKNIHKTTMENLAKKEQRNGKKEEEIAEQNVKYLGWKAMPYYIGNETFENLGTLGTSANMLVYLTSIFNLSSVRATTLLQIFYGTTNLATFAGAFLSDAYFGRYWTLGFASISTQMGMIILTLTAAISSFHPPECKKSQQCVGPTKGQLAILLSALAFLIIGAGGIRPCNLAFGADQFDPNTESGKKGIGSFFNWYYVTFTFTMMISSTVIVYIQSDVSWALGLGIPAVLMIFSCMLFFMGTKYYVRLNPQGSPFTSVAQVIVAAFRKRHLVRPVDINLLFTPEMKRGSINSKLPHTEQFRCLDKAAIMTPKDEIKTNKWRLCTLQQVEEVKCLVRIIPVWSTSILYSVGGVQFNSYVVFQALQSDRRIGKSTFKIPAATYGIFTMIALAIWLPIYDRVIVTKMQKTTGKTGGITMLQRMGVGMVLSVVAMIVGALVEVKRKNTPLFPNSTVSTMSAFWLIPQLVIVGLSGAFNVIAGIEFYYKQFPENMRSVAGCTLFLSSAVASYVSSFMVNIVDETTGGGKGKSSWLDGNLNKGRLEYFYYLIACIGVLNFMYFLLCARWYRYKLPGCDSELALAEQVSTGLVV